MVGHTQPTALRLYHFKKRKVTIVKIGSKIDRTIDILFVAVEWICRFILIFMTAVVTAQVLVRASGSNIKWCEEVMLFLLDCLMFLLLSVGVKYDIHIRFEAIAKHFSRKIRIVLVYFSDIFLLVVSGFMIQYGYTLATGTKAVFAITGIPRSYMYAFTVIGGVLCAITLVAKLFGLQRADSTSDFIEGIVREADDVQQKEV